MREKNMHSEVALKIGAQALEAFAVFVRTRQFENTDLESLISFAETYAKGVQAHFEQNPNFDFNRLRVAAETLRAKLTAPVSSSDDCGSEHGCNGCENHFCKRRQME
jgi:hypothetical protein